MAAGVTPEILAADPRVGGLILDSFSSLKRLWSFFEFSCIHFISDLDLSDHQELLFF